MDMSDDFDHRLKCVIHAIEVARQALEEEWNLGLTTREVERALAEELGVTDPSDLIELCPDITTVIDLLRQYNFQKLRPETLDTITLIETIIPSDVIRYFEEQKLRFNGEIWYIHKNDADPFPSNPHAHNYEQKLKLDLSNGNLFRRKEQVGKITNKNLVKFRSRIKDVHLPPLESGGENALR